MTGPCVTVTDGPTAFDVASSEHISSVMRSKATPSIVAATGRTPLGAYGRLARTARSGLDLSSARVFQLDEYAGVDADDERSLFAWTMRAFASPLGVPADRVVGFDACDPDTARACRNYDAAVVAAGGVDLAILGLGPNGHLGFNEPPSLPDSPTRVVRLTEASIASNAEYWPGRPVPERAFTAGMSVLLAARHIVLLVSGEEKRDILARTLRDPPTPAVPASFLQQHPSVRVIADADAAGRGAGGH